MCRWPTGPVAPQKASRRTTLPHPGPKNQRELVDPDHSARDPDPLGQRTLVWFREPLGHWLASTCVSEPVGDPQMPARPPQGPARTWSSDRLQCVSANRWASEPTPGPLTPGIPDRTRTPKPFAPSTRPRRPSTRPPLAPSRARSTFARGLAAHSHAHSYARSRPSSPTRRAPILLRRQAPCHDFAASNTVTRFSSR
jgi:hypothetical protein